MHIRGVLFFFNDTATTESYTLSLHDALPICRRSVPLSSHHQGAHERAVPQARRAQQSRSGPVRPAPGSPLDRKSTRLNSSHANISYAVFCLKNNTLSTSPSCSALPEAKNFIP